MLFIFSKVINFLLDPLTFLFLLSFILLIKSKFSKKIKFFCWSLWLGIYITATPFFSNFGIYSLEQLVPSKKYKQYDAIVVLTGMVNLSISTPQNIEFGGAVERILKGLELIKKGVAKKLIISGGDGSMLQKNKSEAKLLYQFAQDWGIPKEKIIIDPSSRNTYENAQNTKKIVEKHQFKKLLLITSAFHMFRSLGCFQAVGLNPDVFHVDYNSRKTKNWHNIQNYLPSSASLSMSYVAIHEWFGIFSYKILGRI